MNDNIFFPNTTQVPNFVFDVLMRKCASHPSRLFILLAIIRKTYGWQKHEDLLSLSQIIELTGVSKNAVKDALKFWQKEKIIKLLSKGNGRKISQYRCLLYDYIDSQRVIERPAESQPMTPRESANDPCKGQSMTPQKQIKQYTKTNTKEENVPLSYLNLKSKFSEKLESKGIKYIDSRKEYGAISIMQELKIEPQEILDMVDILEEIKRQNPKDSFLQGICFTMSHLVSYRANIYNAQKAKQSNVVNFFTYNLEELKKEGFI